MLTYTWMICNYKDLGYEIKDINIRNVTAVVCSDIRKVLLVCDNTNEWFGDICNLETVRAAAGNWPYFNKDAEFLFIVIGGYRNKLLRGKNVIQINAYMHTLDYQKIDSNFKDELNLLKEYVRENRYGHEKYALKMGMKPQYSHPVIFTYILIAVNVMCYMKLGKSGCQEYALFGNDVMNKNMFAELFTYMFMHGNLQHLIGNMISLLLLGRIIEKRTGSIKFMAVYIVSGIYAGLVTALWSVYIMPSMRGTVGASGAICGLLGAYLALSLSECSIVRNQMLNGILKTIVIVLISGLFSFGRVDNACHIGGILGGFMFMTIVILCESIKDSKRHMYLQKYFDEKRKIRPYNSRLRI